MSLDCLFMTERDEAILLLKQVRAISQSSVGSRLPLTKPTLSFRTSTDEKWVVALELWHMANDFNQNQGESAIADIVRLMSRVKQLYAVEEEEID